MTIINWTPGLLKKSNLLNSVILLILFLLIVACTGKSETRSANISINNDKEVVTFVYHRFGDKRFPSTNISIDDFKTHLDYLKSNDFQVLAFSEAIDYIKSDAPNRKTAVISVDDGYKSFYDNALPLLQQYGYPATLFINTETVGSGDYMDWESIKKSREEGVEIGNHTHSHAYFLNMSPEERYAKFEDEIKLTQQIIEKNLGFTPEVFAYPYGELDLKMKEIVQQNGFKAAAAQNSGVIYAGSDFMECPRFPMSEYYADLKKFKSKAQMKALHILEKDPNSALLSEVNPTPTLRLSFKKGDLQLAQLQCFIQGSDCDIKQTIEKDTVSIQLKPKAANNKQRRTLYTITVPDKEGNWHWFSHLWVNPTIK